MLNFICNDNLNDCVNIYLNCTKGISVITAMVGGFDNGFFKGAYINGKCNDTEWHTPIEQPIGSQTIKCDYFYGVKHCYLYCLKTNICAKFDFVYLYYIVLFIFFIFFIFFFGARKLWITTHTHTHTNQKHTTHSTTFNCVYSDYCYIIADKENNTAPYLTMDHKYSTTKQTFIHCVTDYSCRHIRINFFLLCVCVCVYVYAKHNVHSVFCFACAFCLCVIKALQVGILIIEHRLHVMEYNRVQMDSLMSRTQKV